MAVESKFFSPSFVDIKDLSRPSGLMSSIVRRSLFSSKCQQARGTCEQANGFIVFTKVKQHFASIKAKVFSEINENISDDTRYICNLLRDVLTPIVKPANGLNVNVRSFTFDGLGNIQGQDPESVSFEQFGGEIKYHLSARIGIERFVDELINLASRNGENISREHFFESSHLDSSYSSIKGPHFDSFVGIGALQKHCEGIEGGETVIYDIGKFCNDRRLKPWNVLVGHSPNPKQIFGEGSVEFMPFNALVPRDEYLEDIMSNYAEVVTDGDGDLVIFRNMITQLDDGSFFAVAHGATPPVPVSEVKPERKLCFSMATSPCRLSTLKKIRRLIHN